MSALALAVLLGLTITSLGCKPGDASRAKPATSTGPAKATSVTATRTHEAPTLASLPDDLTQAFQDRQRCNLLTGCDPEEALVALGPSAARAACAFFDETKGKKDPYYRSRVLRALGRVGGPEAEACLLRALTEEHWLNQATAAFALGDLRAEAAREPMLSMYAQTEPRPGLAVRAGLGYALTRLGAAPALDELWGTLNPGSVSIRNWVYLRFVIRAAAKLKLRAQAGAIAGLVAHPDYYLKREALQALALLGDPSVARAVAEALDADYPGIQREAARCLRALKLVDGATAPKTIEQWRSWRDDRWTIPRGKKR
jgi:HEAT repeats